MKRRIGFIWISLCLANIVMRAQSDVQLSQQMFSQINVNPASTGFSNYGQVFLLGRQQWVGFEGAPSTQLLNLQGFIEGARSGVGLSIMNDIVGRNHTLNFKLCYAYHAKVGEDRYISFGLNAGVIYKRFAGGSIIIDQQGDPSALLEDVSHVRPDVDFGISYSTPRFAIGFSVTHLTRFINSNDDYFKVPLHVYGFVEYAIPAGPIFSIIPRIAGMSSISNRVGDTLTFMNRFNYNAEASLLFAFKDIVWFGAGYRLNKTLVGLVGVNITKNIRIGYSYDFNMGALQNHNAGSHEIMLNYRFRLSNEEYSEATPRFFD